MNSLRPLLPLIKKYPSQIGLNIIFNIISALFSVFSLLMLIPFLQVLFYKDISFLNNSQLPKIPFIDLLYNKWTFIVESQGQETALLVLCLVLVFSFVLKNGTRYLASYFLIFVRTGVMRDLREKVYQKLLALDFSFFQKNRRGHILTIFGNDIQQVEFGIINFIETGFKESVTIIITLISLILLSPYLTLWVFILLPVSALFIGRIGKRLKKDSNEVQNQFSIMQMMIDELMHGIRIIRSFNHMDILVKKFQSVNQKYRSLHHDLLKKKELASPLSETLGIMVVVILLLIGGRAILKGDSTLSPEVFITYIVAFSQIISPAKAFSSAWYHIQRGVASMDRIQSLLQTKSFHEIYPGEESIHTFKDSIEIKNLNFGFDDKNTILQNVEIHIQKGQKVAFVGLSGSGKTTLVNLISGIYQAPENGILMDGIDIRKYRSKDYSRLFAIVTQDPILFYGTIKENLLLANENTDEISIATALKLANAYNFVNRLPEKENTPIGERGQQLSIGQQQRLTLARAYLKNTPILILDEITASVDNISSKKIKDALQQISQEKTVITITHKLESIVDYDIIYLFDKGRIVAQGTHDVLVNTSLLYRQIYSTWNENDGE
ncbi:MAG: ABC transporter ATP-binding protein/permease [Chitinophagales bacterium]|nr:ABC transporter ATP-binding protein/permease [Chitinophagales bacterium]